MTVRTLLLAAGTAVIAWAADPATNLRAVVTRIQQQAAKAPSRIAAELELRAADALKDKHRDLATDLARHSLGLLRSGSDKPLDASFRKQLESMLPGEAANLPAPPAPAAAPARAPQPPEVAAIQTRMRDLRGDLSDAERTRLDIELANSIRALPSSPAKLSAARSLASLSTEGDLGAEALGAVAAALSAGMRENTQSVSSGDYVELASLVRYEHVAQPADAALDVALSYLELRELVTQEAGFNLTGLDGRKYSLEGLRGKVVMVNFWATWCPPCRKEMPDMQKLHQRFERQGLVILAISDEEKATVTKFLADKGYTYPILLDPGRTANTAFGVEGIPKTFIFNREGKLAAQSIDMRTEAQFLKLLKQAGIE